MKRISGLILLGVFALLFSGCEKSEAGDIENISIYLPGGSEVYIMGTKCLLRWNSKNLLKVDIDLYNGSDKVYTIAEAIENSGSFSWNVSSQLVEGKNYSFRISDSENPDIVFDYSRKFGIIPQAEFSTIQDLNGQIYKTVKIGEQWWMAENFNLTTDQGSYSYADVPENTLIYGRLYTLESALANAPAGWHLPDDDDWKELESYLGIESDELDNIGSRGAFAGTLLKPGGIGFNALYGGYHNSCVDYYAHMLWEGHFWSSGITDDNKPIIRVIIDGSGAVARQGSICHDFCSVRYVKDKI